MSAQIMNKKQLVITSTDPESGELFIQNAQLLSAINIHEVPEGKSFKVVMSKDLTNFVNDAPLNPRQMMSKKYGIVFFESSDLKKLDNKVLNVLLSSQIVVTTNDIKPQDIYTGLAKLSKEDDEKEEKQRTLTGILESIILFIRKSDFERLQKPIQLTIKPLFKDAPSSFQGLIDELSAYAGLDKDFLLYHFSDLKDEPLNVITSKITKLLNEQQAEAQKNKDRIKKFEVDKKPKELEAFKKKLAEVEAKKQTDMQEKLAKLKAEGFNLGDPNIKKESLVEKVVRENIERSDKRNKEEDVALLDLLKGDEKRKEKIEKIITDKVAVFKADTIADEAKNKSDEAISKEFFKVTRDFDDSILAQEYESTLSQLTQMYGRRTLVNILVHKELLPILIPTLLKDKKDQQTFICFIKSSFNEALLMKFNSGQKSQLKTIKAIIKNVLSHCIKQDDQQLNQFVQDLVQNELLNKTISTVQTLFEGSSKTVKEYFKTEENVINQMNPFLFVFLVNFFIDSAPKYLLSETTPSVATLIPNFVNICLYFVLHFQEDASSGLITLLYEVIVRLVNFSGSKLKESVHFGVMQHLLNNEIFKKMVKAIDYDDSGSQYNNQMKMLLEVHLKLSDLHTQIIDEKISNMDSNLENSEGILAVKRGKQILKEKQKFDFLRYFIHYQGLEEQHLDLLNQTVEQNHYAFDSKIIAKFSLKQTEMLKLKFRENMKIKDFCFIAIGLNPKIESEMELYSNEDIHGNEKEVTLFKGDFYMIYPIKKQMVIAFGEGANNRLGINSQSNSAPKACFMTKNLNAKRVVSGFGQTIIVDEEDKLWKCGQIEKTSESLAEYNHAQAINEKVKLVTCGKYNITVVTDKNSVFRQGYSKDGHLGLNQEYSAFTRLEKVDDEEQFKEPIIDISSGIHFTMFVTESGKLYGMGNRFLKEISLDCDSKVIQVPLKDTVKVLRVYASNGHNQPVVFIKVQLETGEEQLWSSGRSEQGLLGQGQGVKSSKIFKPVKYDSQAIQFVDIAVHSEHVIAMDQKGQLYGWGSNLQKRAGFKEEIYDGIFEPRRITFYESENIIPIKVSCGFDHSLILFEDIETKQRKLYSVGTNDTNYHHLGITQTEAADVNIYYREVTAFQGFDIVDFCAGHRSSHVIIKGDKDLQSGLQEHILGSGYEKKQAKGILHFYKDQNGVIQYLNESDYSAKGDTLPDISFAIKYPIANLELNNNFPDLIELSKEMIDETATTHNDVECEITKKPIDSGARYFSFSKINGDEQKVNLCQAEFMKPSIFDINPLVYYRIKKPLKAGARLPRLDSINFFNESADYGIDFEVAPSVEYQTNEKLIEVTKQMYDEVVENVSKFPPELDPELLYQVNQYISKNLSDKEVKDIKVKDDFKIADMNFTNAKLKKLSEAIKRRRIELYMNFNQFFIKLMPFIATGSRKKASGDMNKQFMDVKSMILFSMKNKFLKDVINSLPTGSQQETHIKRIKAKTFIETGEVDHTGEFTIFGQLFTQIKKAKNFDCFRMNSTDDRCWRANFVGEGSIDAGGPFRDSLSNIADELESDFLPLLVKTPNNRNVHGFNRECYLPNGESNNPTHHELFKFLGNILGFSIRTQSPLNLHFPPIFWKQILGETPTYDDLKGFDQYTYQTLEGLRKKAKELTAEDFDASIEETFVRIKHSGAEVELKRGGKSIRVTKENIDEYIELNKQSRFNEYQEQMKSIIAGIDHVIPIENLKLFTWEEIEARACGDKIIDIEKFKKMTNYGGCDENHEKIQMFWRVFEQFTDEERTMYLKFVWGRSRLPTDVSGLRYKHTIDYEDYHGDDHLPVAHTCFFSLDYPKYSTDEICKKNLTIAITMCGDIDGDGGANYDPDEGGDNE